MTISLNTAASNHGPQSKSANNALKSGVYSNQLLQGEDPQLLQETIDALVNDFHVNTSYGYQLVQELAQTMLKMTRSERWQCDLIAAHMSKHKTRYEFASQLDLNMLGIGKLPEWYFNDCQKSRVRARKVHQAFAELEHLIKNHSAALMQQIKTALPDLWWYVMGTSAATEKVYTFSDRLSLYSNQSDPVLRLRALKEQMLEKEYYAIAWAQSEERYEAVLSGLRAQAHMNLAVDPNLQRSEASLHRRKTDLMAQLLQIKRDAQTIHISAAQSGSRGTKPASSLVSGQASDQASDQDAADDAHVITYKPDNPKHTRADAGPTGQAPQVKP